MENAKKRVAILVIVCIVVAGIAIAINYFMNRLYLTKISYDEIVEKIDKKESFMLLVSRTNCTHCQSFKPKLSQVAKEYKLTIYYIDMDKIAKDDLTKFDEMFSVSGTPETIFIVDGYEASAATRISGDVSKEKIIAKIKSNGFMD